METMGPGIDGKPPSAPGPYLAWRRELDREFVFGQFPVLIDVVAENFVLVKNAVTVFVVADLEHTVTVDVVVQVILIIRVEDPVFTENSGGIDATGTRVVLTRPCGRSDARMRPGRSSDMMVPGTGERGRERR